jgi:3-oxoacyl-[acyl-carrier-protein] synthase-3
MPSDLSRKASPLRKLTGVQIVGTGSFLPDKVVTNEDLASLGYDADWIIQRTGIRARRFAAPETATSDLAVAAAERCFASAAVARSEVDLLILATMTPDYLLPATAHAIQDRLGLNCAAMDLSAACAGFIYGLITGIQFVATGCSRRALVIGADVNSRIIDPNDRKTYPLFGDGAGAVLLAPGEVDQGLAAYTLGSDGSGTDLLVRMCGGSRDPLTAHDAVDSRWYMRMDGRPVFKWAVRMIEDSAHLVLDAAGVSAGDVDLWLLHQANVRILDAAAMALGVDRRKVAMHLDRYGNTSTGSMPICLDESLREGRIQRGDQLLMCGFGGGLAWGTALFRW